MAIDKSPHHGLTQAAYDGAAITPSDTVPLANWSRWVFVGGAGNLAVTMVGGETVTFTGLVANTLLPIRATLIKVTGTTATNLVAFW
jgi:hypothetical protein